MGRAMSLVLTVLVFVALLHCMCICHSLDGVRHFTKEFPLHGKGCYAHSYGIKENSLAYITVDEATDSGSKNYSNMTVETWFPSAQRKICQMSNEVDSSNRSIHSTSWLPLTKTKFLILTLDKLKISDKPVELYDFRLRMNIIDIVSCNSINFTLPLFTTTDGPVFHFGRLTIFPTVYNTSFDMVLESKEACSGYDKCWLKFDFEGRQIGQPKPFRFLIPRVMIPKEELSPDTGLYLLTDVAHPKWSYMDPAGNIKDLFDRNNDMSVSIENGLLSACQMLILSDNMEQPDTQKYECSQFDGTTMKMNVTVDLPKLEEYFAVHSLVNNKILVAWVDCQEVQFDKFLCQKLRILTIQADGTKSRELQVEGFNITCNNRKWPREDHIFELEDEFCFHFICINSSLMYRKTCIQKKHILKLNDV